MEITTVEVTGISGAIREMRNPYSSWAKSDSGNVYDTLIIGKKDTDLSMRLQKAGPEHCKHLRFIHVLADIKAPLFW